MKLKTSFFNWGIFINDLKRFGWIGIVYILALFFTVPMQILMNYDKMDRYSHEHNPIGNIFHFDDGLQQVLILIVPVLVSIFLFRYLQVKKSTDMFHTLPIKRKTLYDNHIFVGKILLITPVIVTGIVSWILGSTLNLTDYYTGEDVLLWAGIVCLMNMVVFLLSTFVGMITGSSVVQGVLTYILLLLPAGLSLMLFYNMEKLIYGFNWDYYLNDNIDLLSPMVRILELGNSNKFMTLKEAAIYMIFSMILYFLSKFIYNKRKLETATQSIAFSKLQPLFKYGVTFCSMLLGGIYYWETQQNLYWALFGYFTASLIGYFVAEIVLKKSLRVFGNVKGYLIYGMIIILLLLGAKFDVTGYEKSIPSLENVNNIYFNNTFYYSKENNKKTGYYFEKDNLENIYKLHEQIIKDKDLNKNFTKTENVVFKYQLKNGKEVARGYRIPYEAYKKYLKPIYESNEYKKMHYEVLSVNPLNVDKITITPNGNTTKQLVLTNPDDIGEAMEILKNEIQDETYEEMNNQLVPWAEISILLENDKRLNISWKKSYGQFEEWLKQKGYIEKARIMPKDVAYAVIEKRKGQDHMGFIIEEKNKKVKRLEIMDKEKIEYCLRNYTYEWYDDERYIIGFYGENRNDMMYGSFGIEDAPDFIKEYFK